VTSWLFVSDLRYPSEMNMARDEALFNEVMAGEIPGAIRFYDWDKTALTLGYHQRNFSFADSSLDLPVLRRPTGGGAVLHSNDITFSICAPVEGVFQGDIPYTYRIVSEIFLEAFRICGVDAEMQSSQSRFANVCFERSANLELSFRDKKIMGAAQVRKKGFFLLQGVIPLRVDEKIYSRVFGSPVKIPSGIMPLMPKFSGSSFVLTIRDLMAWKLNVRFKHRDKGLKKLCQDL
jgi:lipoate-protein ligase A